MVGGERVAEARLDPGLPFSIGATTFALELPLDGALAAIQGAPEEDTSTFSADRPAPRAEPAQEAGPTAQEEEAPLPVGPEDPLVGDDQRTTREMARPAPGKERLVGRGDLGLIAIGAILLVAAVVGLVLLLT